MGTCRAESSLLSIRLRYADFTRLMALVGGLLPCLDVVAGLQFECEFLVLQQSLLTVIVLT